MRAGARVELIRGRGVGRADAGRMPGFLTDPQRLCEECQASQGAPPTPAESQVLLR